MYGITCIYHHCNGQVLDALMSLEMDSELTTQKSWRRHAFESVDEDMIFTLFQEWKSRWLHDLSVHAWGDGFANQAWKPPLNLSENEKTCLWTSISKANNLFIQHVDDTSCMRQLDSMERLFRMPPTHSTLYRACAIQLLVHLPLLFLYQSTGLTCSFLTYEEYKCL